MKHILIQNGFIQTLQRHQKTFLANAEEKLVIAQTTLQASTNLLEDIAMFKCFSKQKISLGKLLSWPLVPILSDGELEPETLRVEFLPFLNTRLLRKDFPRFKKHVLENGTIKKAGTDLFHPMFTL